MLYHIGEILGNNMVILTDAEKAFDKIKCFIIIKFKQK